MSDERMPRDDFEFWLKVIRAALSEAGIADWRIRKAMSGVQKQAQWGELLEVKAEDVLQHVN